MMNLRLIVASLLLLTASLSRAEATTCSPNSVPQFPNPTGSLFGAQAPSWQQYFGGKVDVNRGVVCDLTVLGTLNLTYAQIIAALGYTPLNADVVPGTAVQLVDGTLEDLVPVQTVTGTSHSTTQTVAWLFQEIRRSNGGSAMNDTLPASTTTGLVNGTWLFVHNVDASAADTLIAGAGTTILGSSTYSLPFGRNLWLTYDLANTDWKPLANTDTAVLEGGGVISALTFGTHFTGGSYNGSAPVTLGSDATSAATASTLVARTAGGSTNFTTQSTGDATTLAATDAFVANTFATPPPLGVPASLSSVTGPVIDLSGLGTFNPYPSVYPGGVGQSGIAYPNYSSAFRDVFVVGAVPGDLGGAITINNISPWGNLDACGVASFGIGSNKGSGCTGYTASNQWGTLQISDAVGVTMQSDSAPPYGPFAGTFSSSGFTPTTAFGSVSVTFPFQSPNSETMLLWLQQHPHARATTTSVPAYSQLIDTVAGGGASFTVKDGCWNLQGTATCGTPPGGAAVMINDITGWYAGILVTSSNAVCTTAQTATFTGAISGGTTLTVSGVTGTIATGNIVQDAVSGLVYGTTITGGSGSSWTITPSQANVAAESMKTVTPCTEPTGTASASANTVTLSSTDGVFAGQLLNSTHIPTTVITDVDYGTHVATFAGPGTTGSMSGESVAISASRANQFRALEVDVNVFGPNVVGYTPESVTCTATSGSPHLTSCSPTIPSDVRPWLQVLPSNSNVLAGATVTKVDSSTSLYLSQNSQGTGSVTLTFYQNIDEGGTGFDIAAPYGNAQAAIQVRGNFLDGIFVHGAFDAAFLVAPDGTGPIPEFGFKYDTAVAGVPGHAAFWYGNSTTGVALAEIDAVGNISGAGQGTVSTLLVANSGTMPFPANYAAMFHAFTDENILIGKGVFFGTQFSGTSISSSSDLSPLTLEPLLLASTQLTSNATVAINLNTSTTPLSSSGLAIAGADSTSPVIDMFASAINNNVRFQRGEGTLASPTSILTGSEVYQLTGKGYSTANTAYETGAVMKVTASTSGAGFSDTDWGMLWTWLAVPKGSVTLTQAMALQSGLAVGPAGTLDEGAGTVNASVGYWINGVQGETGTRTLNTANMTTGCTITYTGGIETGHTGPC